MPQEYRLREAIQLAIQSKKNLFDFYRKAAEQSERDEARKVFGRLAEETRTGLARFYHLGQKSPELPFEQFMETATHADSAMLCELSRELHPDIHERRAREIALREEIDIERVLRLAAERVIDPMARQILLDAADETALHLQVIESEYAHTMRMVHETDIDIFVRE